MDVCIDGVARSYNNPSETEVGVPDGVHHRYQKFETSYAFEDVTLTAIYRGRAIVLANFSHVPSNDLFAVVKYLLDRADDLLHINNVYADSEFANQRICDYITHIGLDYVMANRQTEKTKRKLDKEIKGPADHIDTNSKAASGSRHTTRRLLGWRNVGRRSSLRMLIRMTTRQRRRR